jgi:histone-lysine N-methyltransferase SETMAR
VKFWDPIRRKHPGQPARGVLLHHDNARPHTAQATQERIQELQWELLEHLPYSLDLAPSDFHLFGPLKTILAANVSLMTK